MHAQEGRRVRHLRAAGWHRQARGRGVVSVELALVLPLLLLLLLAIAEIGMIVVDSLAVGNACREGTRAAALGKSTTEIRFVAISALPPSFQLDAQNFTLERRSLSSGVWSAWTTLGDTVSGETTLNDAATGNQIRVTLTYQHSLVTGLILQAANQDGTITLRTASVMLRY